MAFDGIGHVGLFVPDLRAAERRYTELFDMEVAFREGVVDGEYDTLSADEPWDRVADRAEIRMSFCTRNGVTVALHDPDPEQGQDRAFVPGPLDHLNVTLPAAERASVCERAPDYDCRVDDVPYDNDHRYVTTPAEVTWELGFRS